jgi:hypothetical protein
MIDCDKYQQIISVIIALFSRNFYGYQQQREIEYLLNYNSEH